MLKKLQEVLFLALMVTIVASGSVLAQDAGEAQEGQKPVVAPIPQRPQTFGVVGTVESFNKDTLVVKDKKGSLVNISVKELKKGATILATYRQEDGNEKNVLTSLSIIKPAGMKKDR